MTHTMVFGTGEPIDFRLTDDRTADGWLDGTSWEIGLVFTETDEELAELVVEWLDQAAGKVRVTGTETMPVGTYHFRFVLTDVDGNEGYAPTGDKARGIWRVTR